MSLLPGKITICNVKGVSERERERAGQTSGGGWKTDGIGGGVPEPAVRLPLPNGIAKHLRLTNVGHGV